MPSTMLLFGLGLIFIGSRFANIGEKKSTINSEQDYWCAIVSIQQLRTNNQANFGGGIGLIVAAAVAKYLGW